MLLFCKLQPRIILPILSLIDYRPDDLILPEIYDVAIMQNILLFQLLILAIWAAKLYQKPSRR